MNIPEAAEIFRKDATRIACELAAHTRRIMALFLVAQLLVNCEVTEQPASKAPDQAIVQTDSGPAKAPPQAPNNPEPFLDPLAQRLCDALYALPAERKSECCGAFETSSLAGLCGQALSASVQRKAVTIDSPAVEHCAAETARRLEGCGWVTPMLPPRPSACDNLIHGTLQNGAACESSLECTDGLYCRGLGPTRAGNCSAPTPALASCEIPADNLAAFTGFRGDSRHPECQGRCVRARCLPYLAPGAACASSALCPPGLNCIAGHCEDRPLPKSGEACDVHTVCGSGNACQAGQCKPLKNAGESCKLPFECRALQCVKAPGAATGTCGDPCAAAPAIPRSPPDSQVSETP